MNKMLDDLKLCSLERCDLNTRLDKQPSGKILRAKKQTPKHMGTSFAPELAQYLNEEKRTIP